MKIETGVTDGPRHLGHDTPMETQAEFVAKRLQAHTAACNDVFSDPLVRAALADQATAREVIARWNNPQEVVAPEPCAEYHYTGGSRRQAE